VALFLAHKTIRKVPVIPIQLVAQPVHIARRNIQYRCLARRRWPGATDSIRQPGGSSLLDEEPNLPGFQPQVTL
jgi:hypothetical protein